MPTIKQMTATVPASLRATLATPFGQKRFIENLLRDLDAGHARREMHSAFYESLANSIELPSVELHADAPSEVTIEIRLVECEGKYFVRYFGSLSLQEAHFEIHEHLFASIELVFQPILRLVEPVGDPAFEPSRLQYLQ